MYTLEIYVTHMYTNHLFSKVANDAFFTVPGFTTFAVSLICTVVLTGIVIVVLKSIPATNYLFYGKRRKREITKNQANGEVSGNE